nr:hypothetical protein [Paludibacterium denitrificans]
MGLAEQLYRMVSGDEFDANMLKRLGWAARLHEIGLTIAHTAYHKHSAYILQNADMPGFSKREQATLAAIVLGHRGDMGKMLQYVNEHCGRPWCRCVWRCCSTAVVAACRCPKPCNWCISPRALP